MRWLWSSAALMAAGLMAAVAIVVDGLYEQADTRARAEAITGGEAEHGRTMFIAKGCGGCHTVRGVTQATGLVGPPLDGVAERAILAGRLENTPDNMKRWIFAPQSIEPGNAMPNLPMKEQDARDMAAFLYTRS